MAAVAASASVAYLRPWTEARPTEARLRERIEEYIAIRQTSRWDDLFAMADPRERGAVTRERFMSFYAQDMTRLRSLRVTTIRLVEPDGIAVVDSEVEHELVPDRLPANLRRGLNVSDPTALIQKGTMTMDWTWYGGEWYFRMDRVVLTGRDAKGHLATPGLNGRR